MLYIDADTFLVHPAYSWLRIFLEVRWVFFVSVTAYISAVICPQLIPVEKVSI